MTSDATREAGFRALRVSVVAGGVSAVLAVAWGLASGSRVILFDGVSAGIGLLMSGLSLAAARAAASGASHAFPYGRQAMLPLAIGGQGLARLGFTAYAVADAVTVLLAGGDSVETGSALLYAVIAACLCLGVTLWLRRHEGTSELVAAEVLGWRIATILSLAILSGFAVVALLPAGDLQQTAAAYVDPVLVIVVSLIVLPSPVRLVQTMLRELLDMRPPEEIEAPARAAVVEVCAGMGLPEPVIRMTKTGGRLYVEVDHLVEAGTWDVSDIDRLRTALGARLRSPAYTTWINVELSCDPTWQLG
ncbi:MAG TPA: cation transporter [Humibacillus xanthopallidus]|nr:cation transporter [Humibacillus xanthopallidus]